MNKNNFFVFIFSFLFCLIGSEFLLRFLNLGFNLAPAKPSRLSHHEHPYNSSYVSFSKKNEWKDFIISFDKYGNRELDIDCGNIKDFEIIFIGDSFTEGFTVNNKDSFPGLIQKELCSSALVHNLGVSSYSPLLSFIHLKNQNKINPKININEGSIIIHTLYDNDFEEDKKYSKLLKNSDNPAEFFISNESNYLRNILRNSYLARLILRFHLTIQALNQNPDLYIDKGVRKFRPDDECKVVNKNLEMTKNYIKYIKKFIEDKKGSYYLTAIPHDSRRGFQNTNFSCFKDIALELKIPFINPPKDFFDKPSENYFIFDMHINIKGNKLLAKEILKTLLKKVSN